MKISSKKLRRTYVTALLALAIALATLTTATFAWYIFNTSAHTTKVHMAAGTSVFLEIANEYDGPYSTSTILESFTGVLVPVSTDRIADDMGNVCFQEVTAFEADGTGGSAPLVAKIFGSAPPTNYYTTSLYLRVDTDLPCDVYVSEIKYTDDNETYPLSSAARVGFVVHAPGIAGEIENEYIFDINPTGVNPAADYNTAQGTEGHVLDHRFTNGTTIPFTPYTSKHFASYDPATALVTLSDDSQIITTLKPGSDPVQIDVYIWVEGCDPDCTITLMKRTMRDISTSFAAVERKEEE